MADHLGEACVANFDNLYTVRRTAFRRRITRLRSARLGEACRVLAAALGCQ